MGRLSEDKHKRGSRRLSIKKRMKRLRERKSKKNKNESINDDIFINNHSENLRTNIRSETNDLDSIPIIPVKVEIKQEEDPLSSGLERAEGSNFSLPSSSHYRSQFDEHNFQCTSLNVTEVKRENISSEISDLDSTTTISVKTEIQHEAVEIPGSPPPIVERIRSFSPDPGSSALYYTPNALDVSEDDLKNLFNFLYKTVLKFPPHIQTQVKMDLYKTVTEAEINRQCSLVKQNDS